MPHRIEQHASNSSSIEQQHALTPHALTPHALTPHALTPHALKPR
jgi:hypothetical protein